MEETLRALGGILLNAIPTFCLVIFLHFFLKYMFFRPLDRVMQARYEATEGSRKRAEEMLEKAEAKTAEYEAAMRAARAEVYQAQDHLHHQLEEQRKAEMQAVHAEAEAAVKEARARLAADVALAKADLARESELLAVEIADTVLRGGAA